MNNKRSITLALMLISIVIVLGAVIVSAQETPMQQALRAQIIQGQEQIAANTAELQRTDQITVVLCGNASPIGLAGAQSCAAVFVNGQFLLFDIGNNALESMNDSNIPIQDVDAVFLTHYHNDHFADLGEMIEWSWMAGRQHVLPIHGPTGLTQIVDGFTATYALDRSYRNEHHGDEILALEWAETESLEFETPEGDEPVVVYENDGVTVEAFRATHDPVHPAVGYRISYADTLIVISGDTVLTSAVTANSTDADLLIAEVMNFAVIEIMEDTFRELGDERQATLLFDIRDYHMDVSDVAQLALDANVERLALTHLTPYVEGELQLAQLYINPISEVYSGEIIAGTDGLTIIVPLNE